MPYFEYPNGNLADNEYASAADLDQKFQAIADILNGNLDEDNIAGTAKISPSKIGQGGALTMAELSDNGSPGKVPVYGENGEIYCKKLVFKTGLS